MRIYLRFSPNISQKLNLVHSFVVLAEESGFILLPQDMNSHLSEVQKLNMMWQNGPI